MPPIRRFPPCIRRFPDDAAAAAIYARSMIQDSQSNPDWFTAQRLVPALVLIAVGGIFLLSNLHLMRVNDIWEYWPVIPMVMGVFGD